MGEILLLAVGAIVWAIVKAFAKIPQGEQQSGSPHRASPQTDRVGVASEFDDLLAQTALASSKPSLDNAAPLQLVTLEPPAALFTEDEVVRGFIMAEVLGPPLARRNRRR